MQRTTHTIDATNRVPGRVATEVAVLLMGKHKPAYNPATDIGDRVIVKNVGALKFHKKKFEKKIYYSHSGHPGGLKEMPAKNVPPKQVLYQAIKTMLPDNKLRSRRLRRLTIQ